LREATALLDDLQRTVQLFEHRACSLPTLDQGGKGLVVIILLDQPPTVLLHSATHLYFHSGVYRGEKQGMNLSNSDCSRVYTLLDQSLALSLQSYLL
jgi:hypothetical protein